jgi:cobalt-zinc-cadmium efflux system membrane fusion protein
MKTSAFVSLVLAAASVPHLMGCAKEGAASTASPPAGQAWLSDKQLADANIVISAVGEAVVGATVATSGRVTFDDQRVTHVFSPVSGRVLRLLAQPGDVVRKGAPLAELVSPDLQQALSDLRKAEAAFVASDKERTRQKELYEAHAGAQRDLESAESNYEQASAERERARARIGLLGADPNGAAAQGYVLPSPIDGEVIARNVNPGVEVVAGSAVELFTIGRLDRVWLLADVYQVDLPRVHNGAPVTIKLVGYPDRVFEGAVDWVSGAFDPASRTAKVRCSLPNPDQALRPEMYASVSIGIDTHRALAVPRSAVLRLGDQAVAFVEMRRTPDGRRAFERRTVVVNDDGGGDNLPIVKGLEAGEHVVTTGAILLAGMV